MTEPEKIAKELRDMAGELRTRPVAIRDTIPLMTRAADELDSVREMAVGFVQAEAKYLREIDSLKGLLKRVLPTMNPRLMGDTMREISEAIK